MLVESFVDFAKTYFLFCHSICFIFVLLSAILLLSLFHLPSSSPFFFLLLHFFFSFLNNVCGSFPIKCYTIEVSGVQEVGAKEGVQ